MTNKIDGRLIYTHSPPEECLNSLIELVLENGHDTTTVRADFMVKRMWYHLIFMEVCMGCQGMTPSMKYYSRIELVSFDKDNNLAKL